MGEQLATWEMIALGAIAIIALLLFYPGLRRLTEQSREAEKDWPGFLIPVGAVVLFVILLIVIT